MATKNQGVKMNEVSVMENAVGIDKLKAHVDLIQSVMKSVMKDGEHYGVIPGCGKKPALLKAGAEKLSMTFRLRPVMKEGTEDIKIIDLGLGHREVVVMCHILSADGTELATGVGSCSTMESKYRYRGGMKVPTDQELPKEYWNLRKSDPDGAQTLIGGKGFTHGKNDAGQWVICEFGEKVENPDLADVWNTVLKMAKKRAYVDGMLSATGASDIFTQDIEEMAPADVGGKATDVKTESAKSTASAAPAPKDAIDIIALSQCKVGQVVNVKGYVHGVKAFKSGTKNTPLTDFTVGDLADEPTTTIMIRIFGTLDAGKGEQVCFNQVKVEEFQGAIKYLAKEIVNA
jgi:hypothetical protein